MNLEQLLESANQSNNHSVRCQARNVALDFAELASNHPDAGACGNQLPHGALSYLQKQFTDTNNFDDPNDTLGRNFAKVSYQLRPIALASPVIGATENEIKLVRYTDLNAIHEYWFGLNKTDSSNKKKATFKQLQAIIQRNKNKAVTWLKGHPQLAGTYLGKPDAFVWVSPGDTPPHLENQYQQSTTPANSLVRNLALPIAPETYQKRVGLVAIQYRLPQNQLYKPNIAHSEGYAVFFPGLKAEPHGRTAPRNQAYEIPWCRNDYGIGFAEYIHDGMKLVDIEIDSIEYVGDFK